VAQRDRGRTDFLSGGQQTRQRPEGVSAMRVRHVLGDRGVAPLKAQRAWLATRVPRWNTSMVASVARTLTTWRITRDGTE